MTRTLVIAAGIAASFAAVAFSSTANANSLSVGARTPTINRIGTPPRIDIRGFGNQTLIYKNLGLKTRCFKSRPRKSKYGVWIQDTTCILIPN